MTYSLVLEKEVVSFLSKLDKHISKRIVEKIETLTLNPFPSDCKRIVNTRDLVFRIRVGNFRVLYRVENNVLIVVFLVDKRSRVYNK